MLFPAKCGDFSRCSPYIHMNNKQAAQSIIATFGDRYQLHALGEFITPDQLHSVFKDGLIEGCMYDTAAQCIDPNYDW